MKLTKKQLLAAVGITLILFVIGYFFINSQQTKTRENSGMTKPSYDNEFTEETSLESITDIMIDDPAVPYNDTDSLEKTTTEESTLPNYKKLIDFDADFPYMIKVNRIQNWVMVYGIDKQGHYSIPYKIFLCSTGLNEGDTPLGTFSISDKYEWRLMVDGSYAQYATRINGPIMLHSVPYYSPNKYDLEVEEYTKLGEPASLGCIRMNVKSIKWIYDNCPKGTIVVVYDSAEEEPLLELPKMKKAKSTGPKAGWDPTDPDINNPWKKKKSNN